MPFGSGQGKETHSSMAYRDRLRWLCYSVVHNTLIWNVIAYIAIGGLLVPPLCTNLSYSRFYRPSPDLRTKLLAKNEEAVVSSRLLLQTLNTSPLRERVGSKSARDICFVIISVSRPKRVFYLTQVVAHLAAQVLQDNGTLLAVVNAEGHSHTEAVSLSQSIPVLVPKYPTAKGADRFDRQRTDYMAALQWCAEQDTTFTVVMEDDAFPQENFVSRLKYLIHHRLQGSSDWAFVKLFYPEKYQGWGNDPRIIAELVICSTVGAVVLTGLVSWCLHMGSRPVCDCSLLFRLLISIALVVYILLVIGRPHFLALRQYTVFLSTLRKAPGCCIPAVLYPHRQLQPILSYLNRSHCSFRNPIDIALDSYAADSHYSTWLVEPNMVTHIGFLTSLPKSPWKTQRELGYMLNSHYWS